VLGLGIGLHPDGPKAAFTSLPDVFRRMKGPGPELALIPVILAGTLAVHAGTYHRQPDEGTPTVEATPAPTAAPVATPTRTPSPSATPRTTARPASGAPAPGTRRLVLQAERAEVPMDSSVPMRGPEHAPVQIALFGDFQCPYCKKLAGNVEVLLEEPALKDKVRVGFMHFPMHQSCNSNDLSKSLHKYACAASAAAICAQEQGKFWEMHDLLFRNNSRLRTGNLRGYARELGLDQERWKTCVSSQSTRDKLMADSRIGGAAGVTGTPSLFVNGRRLVGAQPVESLLAAVQVELDGTEGRVLLDVELDGETLGDLSGAAPTVTLEGPDGRFTIDAFQASVQAGRAVSEPGVAPARSYTWADAQAACEAAGKRLCTEQEWLTACTGAVPIDEDRDGVYSRDLVQGRQHAYGEHYREGWCADSRKSDDDRPLLTGDHPKCATPEGVYDLEGVTKEWIGITIDKAVLKGGSYKSGASARCAYYKDSEAPDTRDDSIGFRCCSGGDPDALAGSDEFPGGKVGDEVRDFAGPQVGASGSFGTAQVRGKPFIMTFWATWCEPCKKELPALAEAWEKHHGEGLQVIGINVDSDPSKTRAWLRDNPLPFPVILDTDKAIMDTFQSRNGGVPLTFWVQRDGVIRQRSTGYDDAAHAQFMESVRQLLAK
jgi:protein-disulfide isomerase/peroxiredoxin